MAVSDMAIETQTLTKHYGQHPAVLDLAVPQAGLGRVTPAGLWHRRHVLAIAISHKQDA